MFESALNVHIESTYTAKAKTTERLEIFGRTGLDRQAY